VESAFACMDAITDAALLQGDAARAAGALQAFVARTPYIPALAKLAGISVEAGLGDRLHETQAQLVDAYLDASRGKDARTIAEDLVRGDPTNEAHAQRLLRALTLEGEHDPEDVLARLRSRVSSASTDALSLDALDMGAAMTAIEEVPDVPMEALSPESSVPNPPVPDDEDEGPSVQLGEIDLSTELSDLASVSSTDALDASEQVLSASEPTPDIEGVFAQMRANSAREQQASAALAQYEEATRFIEQGLDREAIAALEAAARVPMLRFKAAARLGRFLIDRGDLNEGVDWLERAAEAPAPSPEEGYDLLYELAGALEAQGESARALAVLMELDAEADG